MGIGAFWLVFSAVQLAVAGYVLLAVLSWRGARFRPAPGHPLAALPAVVLAAVWLALVAAIVVVRDGEFARYLGTGGLMVVAVASLLVLAREDRRRG